ncbi:MAG: Ig-like domain-containing protein, partial [Actinomycetota bacterium]|nr:Ig-like domain-containing protein [Actinomycetota bacterium]
SDNDGLFGRLNKPAGSLDLAVNPPGGVQSSYRLDIRQDGAAVAAWDQGSGRLMPVDVAVGKTNPDQAVPVSSDEQVAIAGGTIAVLDAGADKVWADHVDQGASITTLAGLDPSARPVMTLPKATGVRTAALAVGSDGTVYTATSQGTIGVTPPKGAKFAKTATSDLGQRLESVQVTVIGSQVVVYDAKQGVVHLPGKRTVHLPADADAQLQKPSGGGSSVVIATRTTLYSVPLTGGRPTTLYTGAAGRPTNPTWLGPCVHAAWAGQPGTYARACDGEKTAKRIALPHNGVLEEPVFRVNRGSILLNDLALGSVYDLDTLQEVDNWSAVKPPPLVKRSNKDKKNTASTANRDQPPKAVDDTWGARPGRTTVLHVLDNDSDPQGAILSIKQLGPPSDPSASVTIAPDGQSVEVALPAQNAKDVQFKYTIDDGKGLTAEANVDVQVRGPGDNAKPRKRQGFTQPAFTVSSGGTLDLPVLDDWRDFDGDPLVILAARVDGAGLGSASGTVTTAPSGRLDFIAPAIGGSETIVYDVSDGSSAASTQRIPVTVLAPSSNQTSPPIANADIARGQVGKPIVIKPLANDLPGADPSNPDAALALAGTVANPAGVRVDTDLKSGSVTVTGTRPGTFALNYTASFGNAKFAHAAIRVDIAPPAASAQPPVAVPDTGVLYGQTAATIDVLANDFDPAGGVLVVQHTAPADGDQIEASVVDGRFLRVAARRPDLTVNPQVIDYTITNGQTNPVHGELTVIQKPPLANDTPLAIDDYATVRSGDSALVPVLDNDIDPAGAALTLLNDVPRAPAPGRLTVTADGAPRTDVGAAFVSNKQVRYAAPVVSTPTAVSVAYVARNADGNRAAGTLHVTITPPPSPKNPDQPPAAQPISARAVSGQTVRIAIATTGIDPDGDTANVIGISSAPTLGRIVSIGSTSITYEAFPTTSGTDRFGYLVSDPFGKTSTSTVSVGVAQVSDPQPPSAVDDSVTASPGAKVRVDALANDVIASDDAVSIGKLHDTNPELSPATAELIAPGGPIQIVAPPRDGESIDVQYAVSDGSSDPSVATITVRSQAGYVPPPTVVDVPAAPKPGEASTVVDVLAKATDPQGLPLRIAKVFDAGATVTGGKITLPVLPRVQNVVFQVANSKGGTAAAVIHVPARSAGRPYVRPAQLITIGRDKSRTVDLRDYVIDPANLPLRLTTTDKLATAPGTGLRLTSPDPTHLTITGVNGYNGPAAITFEVTDGKTLNDPNGHLALLTLQVQVGPNTPVVRCPSAPIRIVEGGPDRRLDIASLCHVWLADRSQLDRLDFTASWAHQPKGVEILGNGSHVIGLRAGGSAAPGAQGALTIGVKGTQAKSSTVNVSVLKLGRGSMNPIRIDGFKAGATATQDIRGSVSSPLRDPKISIVSIRRSSGMASRASATGSQVRITPGANSHGLMTFDLVVTDVADKTRLDRHFAGRLTLQVLNVPDAPGAPQAGRTVLSQTVVLSWPTPAANGAPIDLYQVGWAGGSQTCAASPCRIANLRNGTQYRFTVRAHNGVGYSKPSPALSPPAKPDRLPAAVTSMQTSNPQDHAVTVSWLPVSNGGSPPKSYRISWSGGGSASAAGTARSVVARGLDNHNVYTFTVVAVNDLGAGPPASARGQSAGIPAAPANVTVNYANQAGTTQRAVTVSWTASDSNGAGPSTYTVTRNAVVICRDTPATSCNDTPATAQVYTYSVVARNAANHSSGPGSTRFTVTGTPDPPTSISSTNTAKDGQLAVAYTVPNSYGRSSRVECKAYIANCGPWVPAGKPGTREPTHLVDTVTDDID